METKEWVAVALSLSALGTAIYKSFIQPSQSAIARIDRLTDAIEHQNEVNEIKNSQQQKEFEYLKKQVESNSGKIIDLDGRLVYVESFGIFKKDR